MKGSIPLLNDVERFNPFSPKPAKTGPSVILLCLMPDDFIRSSLVLTCRKNRGFSGPRSPGIFTTSVT